VDAAKARPFLERAGEARLVDQASGAALEAAVRGARPPETAEAAGRVCPLLFDDTLRKVGPGAHVALSLPGIEVRDLAVGE
jgi:hypothetical protein